MGSKSSNAPPPDPKLVEAQLRSMGIQDQAITEIMANAKELMPIQKEQMQFGLDSSRKAYDQSQEDRGWMLGRRDKLSGLQDTLVTDAQKFNTEDRANELAGAAMGDVNTAFTNAREQNDSNLAHMGVDPNSGRALATRNATSIAQAAALAGAATGARTGARMEGRALTDRATNALAGYPAMAAGASGAGAGFGANGLTLANQGLAGMNSGYGAGATVAGQMGSNAAGMYGKQADYKLNADKANNNDALWGAAGKVAGALILSDKKAKKNIKKTSTKASLAAFKKMPVSNWNYKKGLGDGGNHTGPMAQDVRKGLGDSVAPGGKMIDMISMAGHQINAIKELDKRLSKVEKTA